VRQTSGAVDKSHLANHHVHPESRRPPTFGILRLSGYQYVIWGYGSRHQPSFGIPFMHPSITTHDRNIHFGFAVRPEISNSIGHDHVAQQTSRLWRRPSHFARILIGLAFTACLTNRGTAPTASIGGSPRRSHQPLTEPACCRLTLRGHQFAVPRG